MDIFKKLYENFPLLPHKENDPTAPRVETARRSKHMGATKRPKAAVVAERRAKNRRAKQARKANR